MNDFVNKHLEDDRHRQLERPGMKRIVFLEKEALKLEKLYLYGKDKNNDK